MKKLIVWISVWIMCLLLFSCGDEENLDTVTVDVLKTGKADCIVIDTGYGIVMIDTAETENLPDIYKYMEEKGYDCIDTLIITHYDKDHVGGAVGVINNYKPNNVIEWYKGANTDEYINYHNMMADKGIIPEKIKENKKFNLGECYFEIDVPKKTKYEEKNDNNTSLIISMSYKDKNFLFCGDAMELRLQEFISTNSKVYDFVKIPYHGRYLDNYAEFLNSSKPTYCAITNSKKNPSDEKTLKLLDLMGIEIYETRYGEINIKVSEKEIEITRHQ